MTSTYPLARTTSEPCRACGGPVHYSGRGRKPVTCSPACDRLYRSTVEARRISVTRRARRVADDLRAAQDAGASRAELLALVAALPDYDLLLAALVRHDGDPDDWSKRADVTPEGFSSDNDDWRGPSWRAEYDAAARWIADERPGYLDEWRRDYLAADE